MVRFIHKEQHVVSSESHSFTDNSFTDLKDLPIDLSTYNSISELLLSHSVYISTYIQLLNKYINLLKKASTLKNERNLLIKFVKKLRFFNNYYYFKELIYVPDNIDTSRYKILEHSFVELSNDLQDLQQEKDLLHQITMESLQDEDYEAHVSIGTVLHRVVASNCKLLELVEILNFVITNSLKNEIMTKTLNEKLIITDELDKIISHLYCIFIKFNQWIVEAVKLDRRNGNLDIELLELVLKNDANENINTQPSEDDELLLQEVDQCNSSGEFNTIMWQWCDIIRNLLKSFDQEIENVLNLAGNHSNNGSNMAGNHSNSNSTISESSAAGKDVAAADDAKQQNLKPLHVPKRTVSIRHASSSGNRRVSSTNRHSRYGAAGPKAPSANSSFY